MSEQQEFEVVKANGVDVSTQVETSEWGDGGISASDIIIPKLLIMQPTSEDVTGGKFKMGDIINSMTEEVVGGLDKPIMLHPFLCKKIFLMYKITKTGDKIKKEFYKVLEDKGQTYPFDSFDYEGIQVQAYHTYQFFAMVEGNDIPVTMIFKSSAHKVGKQLFNVMYVMNKMAGLTPPAYWIEYGLKREKGEQSTWCVPVIKTSRKATAEEISKCAQWVAPLMSLQMRHDDEDAAEAKKSSGPAQF